MLAKVKKKFEERQKSLEIKSDKITDPLDKSVKITNPLDKSVKIENMPIPQKNDPKINKISAIQHAKFVTKQ